MKEGIIHDVAVSQETRLKRSVLNTGEIENEIRETGYYLMPAGTTVAVRVGISPVMGEIHSDRVISLGSVALDKPQEVRYLWSTPRVGAREGAIREVAFALDSTERRANNDALFALEENNVAILGLSSHRIPIEGVRDSELIKIHDQRVRLRTARKEAESQAYRTFLEERPELTDGVQITRTFRPLSYGEPNEVVTTPIQSLDIVGVTLVAPITRRFHEEVIVHQTIKDTKSKDKREAYRSRFGTDTTS